MGTALGQIWILLWKDLLIDLRRLEHLLAMFFFGLLTLLIFNFAIGDRGGTSFRYTARVEQRMLAQGVTGEILSRLAPMKGSAYDSQRAFLQALDAMGSKISPLQRVALLQASRERFVQSIAGGLFWVTFLLAGILGLERAFGQEKEQGCMDGLLLTPVPRGVIYLGKMASNALFLAIMTLLLFPLLGLLFELDLSGLWLPLGVVAGSGIVGFSALGTLLGGVTASLRGKEVLLPLLLFPLMVPVLLVVVQLTDVVLQGESLWAHIQWLQLVAAFDIIFLIASYLIFDVVMEA